jgi:hypothetical protein
MTQPLFDLAAIEKAARGRNVVAVVVTYFDRADPVEYAWANRKQARWPNVRRVSLKLADTTCHYVGNGDYRTVDRVRVKSKK